MDDVDACAEMLRTFLAEIRPNLPTIAVALVISERGATPSRDDYAEFTVAASFLESFEIDSIVAALRSSGMYVHHFNDEVAFITWASTGGVASMPRPHEIVYTSAVNGIGAGRRSLVPAFCALQRIPTVNSDAYSCAINRHKFHWNTLLRAFGFPAPRCWSIDPELGWHLDNRPPDGAVVVGKATYEGSSIGLTADLAGAFGPTMARRFREVGRKLRQPLTVQEFVAGDEFEVPVIETPGGLVAPATIGIFKADGFPLGDRILAYDEVWDDSYHFAINESSACAGEMRRVAVGVARTLGFRGFSRVDFRVGRDGRPLVIDVSSTPHLTRTSSFTTLFEAMGFAYDEMWAIFIGLGARLRGIV